MASPDNLILEQQCRENNLKVIAIMPPLNMWRVVTLGGNFIIKLITVERK